MIKRLFSLILCILILISFSSAAHTVSAAIVESGNITVDTVTGLSGDTVVVSISIKNNPGFAALTLSINYNSSVLEYEKYYAGFLSDYMVVAHPDNNIIRFVNCESRNRRENGKMISLQFKINEDADTNFYPISITCNPGDISNWKLNSIMPTITAGGVDVTFNKAKCRHKTYGEWVVVADPGCTEKGVKSHTCKKCEHVELAEINATGHNYSNEWTIDEPATADTDGIMSKHCKNCDSRTDFLSFSYKQAKEEKIDNSSGSTVKHNELTDELVKEQLPDGETQTDKKSYGQSKTTIVDIIQSILEEDEKIDNNTTTQEDKSASEDNDENNKHKTGESNSDGIYDDEKKEKSDFEKIVDYLFFKNGSGLIGKITEALPKHKLIKSFFIVIIITMIKFFSII